MISHLATVLSMNMLNVGLPIIIDQCSDELCDVIILPYKVIVLPYKVIILPPATFT